MSWLGLHPLLVHFPVSLLAVGSALTIYGGLQKDPVMTAAAEFNIRLGFWCALAAAGSGGLGVLSLDIREEFAALFRHHLNFALATILLFGSALALARHRARKSANVIYHVLILAGLLCVLAAGLYGGELTHRFGVGTPHPRG